MLQQRSAAIVKPSPIVHNVGIVGVSIFQVALALVAVILNWVSVHVRLLKLLRLLRSTHCLLLLC